MKTILETNRRLCEKSGDLEEILVAATASEIEQILEAADGKAAMYRAKVSHADVPNQNERIYTRELWAVTIEAGKKKIEEGKLGGACDHPDWSGGLKDTCIKWHSLMMDSAGAVYGEFSLIDGANHAAHMAALIRAKSAIGFSTRGRGRAHYPDEAERKRYGLPDDTDVVIIGAADEYELKKIDAVDDPSVIDAYKENRRPASEGNVDENRQDTQEPVMKNLEELKSANPALHALHEQAVTAASTTAVAAAEKPLKEKIADLEPKLATATADLKTANTALEAAKETANSKVAELQGKLDAENKVRLNLERKQNVAKELPTLLKDNKFSDRLTKAINGADGKAGKIEDEAFDVNAAKAFIAEKTSEWTGVANDIAEANKNLGITGTDGDTTSGGGGDDKLTAESVAKEFKL